MPKAAQGLCHSMSLQRQTTPRAEGLYLRPAVLRAVSSRPPRIQLLGLLPAILKPCGPACAQPFTNESVEALKAEERRETPAFVRENAERAHGLAEQLLKDFGPRIRIEVVGLDSPRGVWLGIRHRVGKGFAVIVDGNEVFRNSDEYESVKQAVARAITAHNVPA